jgi:Ni2+-binding GTPase involved in maturation of urease and hydrogenase
MDLCEAVECDEAVMRANIQGVRPGMRCFAVSAKTGTGVEEYLRFLIERLAESARQHAALKE